MPHTDPASAKKEPKAKPEPLTACIAVAVNRHGASKCGRCDTEREFLFTDADYAVEHYDRSVRRIPDTMLAACPKCIVVRKREQAEETAAYAK